MPITKKQLENLRPAKKGEIRNPHGARAHKNGRLKGNVKRLTALEVERIGALVLRHDLQGLKKLAQDDTASVLMVWVASCAAKAIIRGDAQVLDVLLNRFIGKVKDRIQLTSKNNSTLTIVDLVKTVHASQKKDLTK